MPRRLKPVTQYPENISREALEEHHELMRELIRGRTGIHGLTPGEIALVEAMHRPPLHE